MGSIRRVGPGCSIGPAGRQGCWRHLYQPSPGKVDQIPGSFGGKAFTTTRIPRVRIWLFVRLLTLRTFATRKRRKCGCRSRDNLGQTTYGRPNCIAGVINGTFYFAADAGDNDSHRIYVVENDNDDPIEGTWTFKGKISDSSDKWAIDPTTFELNGEHYLLWSGWKGNNDGEQDLFIAHMSNPWTIDSPRTLISEPTYPWEEHGDLPGRHVNVNEGPEFISRGNKMFIVFSASGCWTDFYTLGVLEANLDANPLDAKSWTKINHPFLQHRSEFRCLWSRTQRLLQISQRSGRLDYLSC